eukprot:360018-Chlamydomonas_euryale.AAC.1
MSNQNPAVGSDPHPFAICSPSTEGSVYKLQRHATLFAYSLKPVAVRQLHANNAAETVRMSDL